jgi:hypothetical protein
MINLTLEQREELSQAEPVALDPVTKATYVLVPQATYERLKELYDDSPWTDEETALLAAEAGELLDNFGKDK